MMEYQEHLEKYKSEYYFIYNTFLNEKDWGNESVAKQYLQKYWLKNNEYQKVRINIQNKIFSSNFDCLPQRAFLSKFEIIPNIGGVLFDEQEFESLKKCFVKTGDKFFYVFQNNFGKADLSAFRMKFPTNLSWNELIGGNYISTVLFEMFHNEYFVFGDSILWGKYCANDEKLPIDIYGVDSNLVSVFLENFKNLRVINPTSISPNPNFPNLDLHCSNLSEIKDSLPNSYKDFYKIH